MLGHIVKFVRDKLSNFSKAGKKKSVVKAKAQPQGSPRQQKEAPQKPQPQKPDYQKDLSRPRSPKKTQSQSRVKEQGSAPLKDKAPGERTE
ncbi:MAG: hypothetical protein WCJ01_07010, partial [Ignavibacteria bacterium]